jgi:hypothetical protein
MSSTIHIGNNKNFFCRDKYWQLLNSVHQCQVFKSIPGANLRDCTYGDKCRGAHSPDEISILPNNYKFDKMDKSTIDLVQIYKEITTIFDESEKLVINPDYKKLLADYKKLDFVELLNFWFQITCYHRRVKKELRNGGTDEYYNNINTIPEFFLESEETVWPLERITKMCPKNENLLRKVNHKFEKPILWDICCGSINCKEGCHNIGYLVCKEDMLNGECGCLTKSTMEERQSNLLSQIQDLKDSLICSTGSDGFKTTINPKKKKIIQNKINTLETDYSKIIRMVHLTDQGLIPFNKQMELEKLKQEQEKIVKQEEIRKKEVFATRVVKKKIVKPVF